MGKRQRSLPSETASSAHPHPFIRIDILCFSIGLIRRQWHTFLALGASTTAGFSLNYRHVIRLFFFLTTPAIFEYGNFLGGFLWGFFSFEGVGLPIGLKLPLVRCIKKEHDRTCNMQHPSVVGQDKGMSAHCYCLESGHLSSSHHIVLYLDHSHRFHHLQFRDELQYLISETDLILVGTSFGR